MGLVRDAHTQHTRTHEQAELQLSCPAVVLLCSAVLCRAPAVLWERSIGPLCSGVHGKQGPVGRCLARPGMLPVAMQTSLVVKLSDPDPSSSLDLDHG